MGLLIPRAEKAEGQAGSEVTGASASPHMGPSPLYVNSKHPGLCHPTPRRCLGFRARGAGGLLRACADRGASLPPACWRAGLEPQEAFFGSGAEFPRKA